MKYLAPNNLYLPKKEELPLTIEDISLWYNNLNTELSNANYSLKDLSLLADKINYYGKYFSKESKKFFLHHFADNLAQTTNYLFRQNKINQRFLEIGCGCGNQLILSALLESETVGCDIRNDVCELIGKRKEFYEKVANRKLNITYICDDAFKIDWSKLGKFDSILMLFSFNYLKPNNKILRLVSELINPGGRLVIQDRNVSNYYNVLFRKRKAMKPKEVADMLLKYNFKIDSLRGGYAIPPIFWRFLPNNIIFPAEKLLRKSIFLSVSYHLMAEKLNN